MPDNLNFYERREQKQKEETQALMKMEREIKEEIEKNVDINQIYNEWKRECEDEGSLSDWSDMEMEEEKDMDVDRDQYYINRTDNVQRELEDVFGDHKVLRERGQVLVEKHAPIFQGTPVHYEISPQQAKPIAHPEQGSDKFEDEPMNDDDALKKMLSIRSFDEILHEINSKKTKNINSGVDTTESIMSEPLNLALRYSQQYQSEKDLKYVTLAQRSNSINKDL